LRGHSLSAAERTLAALPPTVGLRPLTDLFESRHVGVGGRKSPPPSDCNRSGQNISVGPAWENPPASSWGSSRPKRALSLPSFARRRLSEEAAILARELRHALIANLVGGDAGLQPLGQHQAPS